jgi:hypothetical protein
MRSACTPTSIFCSPCFLFFDGTRDWIQDFMLTKQALYNYLSGLASHHSPPALSLPGSWYYRRELLVLGSPCFLMLTDHQFLTWFYPAGGGGGCLVFFFFFFLWQGFAIYPRLAWNSLCSLGWSQTYDPFQPFKCWDYRQAWPLHPASHLFVNNHMFLLHNYHITPSGVLVYNPNILNSMAAQNIYFRGW